MATVGAFQSDAAGNVIANSAILRLSIRTTTPEDRETVLGNVRRLIAQQSESFGGTSEIRQGVAGAVLTNDPEETRKAAKIARDAFGPNNVSEDGPTFLGSEDFAFMLQNVRAPTDYSAMETPNSCIIGKIFLRSGYVAYGRPLTALWRGAGLKASKTCRPGKAWIRCWS